MPAPPNLDPDDYRDIAQLLRETIAADPYFMSPRIKRLKAILAKLDPESSERKALPPLPPRKPAGEPSLALRKLNRRRTAR